MTYATKGVCSREIHLDVADGIINEVKFLGGCHGNLKAIGILVKGKPAQEVIRQMEGLTCGDRPTSCGDQLALALKEALAKGK